MPQIINKLTGEIVDLETATNDTLMANIKELETHNFDIYSVLKALRSELQQRMQKDGSTLAITSLGKVRLKYTSRVKDTKIVQALYKICPEQLKAKAFAFDIRPLKSGLNEVAKLGSTWKEQVDSIYEQVPSMTFEWTEEGK